MEYIKNKVGREIPKYIEGIGELRPYERIFSETPEGRKHAPLKSSNTTESVKLLDSIREAVIKCGLKDGMVVSFHHHLRNGDYVLNMVMKEIADLGIKDITIFSSSLIEVHEPLIDHIKNGVVTGLHTSGVRGKLAQEISKNNILGKPVVFRSHGGRARAIELGEVKIDVAFIAAPACDDMGNLNGCQGKSAFGSIGYAMVDAQYADKVVAITDNLMPYPLNVISIPQTLIDYVVVVDEIGDPTKISNGATRVTKSPTELLIADYAAEVLKSSGLVKNDFSFQAGSGGASLAVARYLAEYMRENNIVGSFASGGITSNLVELMEEGLFRSLLDTQTFDGAAAQSIYRNTNHIEMSASMYANPFNKGCVAHKLDIMMLSATEVDTDFNVNVLTGSTGMIMGAVGGHQDTAVGAKLVVVVAPLIRKRLPIIMDKVTTIITPGETVDVVVTERGVAVNPRRVDLLEKLKQTKLPLMTINELKDLAESFTGKPEPVEFLDEIVGIVEYRDGTVIDVVKRVKS